jgi:FKBP-type peptidyl-prolyl cis-trans isomerase SlyD
LTIAQDSVVTIHYTLKDDAGEIIDSSVSADPLAYLHGQRMRIGNINALPRGHPLVAPGPVT